MRVSVKAQISSSRCQSLELRANRETSQPNHQPGVPHAHLGHELFKTFTIYRGSARLPEIVVDDNDAIGMPAESDGALPQCVLTLGARVFQHLTRSGLTYIKDMRPV